MDISILNVPDPTCDAFVLQHPNGYMSQLPACGFMVEWAFGDLGFDECRIRAMIQKELNKNR